MKIRFVVVVIEKHRLTKSAMTLIVCYSQRNYFIMILTVSWKLWHNNEENFGKNYFTWKNEARYCFDAGGIGQYLVGSRRRNNQTKTYQGSAFSFAHSSRDITSFGSKAGKRERCPHTQKFRGWPIPTRNCHRGQPSQKCNGPASPWRSCLSDHRTLPAR